MEKQGGKYQIDHWNVQQGTGKAANRTGKVLQRCQRALRQLLERMNYVVGWTDNTVTIDSKK